MSTARHHLPEDLLLAYAAGTCNPAEALFVATHLTLCPRCRSEVERLEAVGGEMLATIEREAVSSSLLEATLSRLDEPAPVTSAPRPQSDGVLPTPLLSLVGPLEQIRWSEKLFGAVKYLELPVERGGRPMRMKRIKRGQRIPEHTHDERELELYLAGGALDVGTHKRYQRGDVSTYEAGERHKLEVDADQDCILLCLDVRLIGTSLSSKVVYGLIGWD